LRRIHRVLKVFFFDRVLKFILVEKIRENDKLKTVKRGSNGKFVKQREIRKGKQQPLSTSIAFPISLRSLVVASSKP